MGGCGCGGDCEKCAPTSAPDIAARHVRGLGRFRVNPQGDIPGDFGRPYTRAFDVQPLTGYVVSTVPEGQWQRGAFFYGPTMAFRLPGGQSVMFDRTDPRTWPTRLTG